jgi:phospholipid transport system substrate-binding protein
MLDPAMRDGSSLGRRSVIAAGSAAALAVLGDAPSTQAQGTDAQKPVAELNQALESVMHMGRGVPFQQRFDHLAAIIDRVFNLDAILQTSIGLRWSTLDEAARRTLFTVFRAFTIASYTANFDKDAGEKFEILPQTRASGSDIVVETKLIASNGEPIRIDYVMRGGPGNWRIVDVLLDGSISRVAVQRSDFRSLLASGDPGPLINSLRKKVADLSGGAIRLS